METAQQWQCPAHNLDDEYNPLVAPQLTDPFPVWARARSERPVFYSSAVGAWVVTRYADIVSVLRNPGEFGPGVERKTTRLPGMRLAANDGLLFKPSATQRMAQRLYVEWK